MYRALKALAFSLAFLGVAPVGAQDVFKDVEYLDGKAGFPNRIKGTLIVAPQALRFLDQDGEMVFSIPIETIKDVTNDVQIRDASVGMKLLFGGLAGSRKQEFVQISTESADCAEGVVFKVKQNQSLNATAKIRFAVKRAAEREARDSAATISAATPPDSTGQ